MTLFRDTDAAAEFIATADSRNTSPEVMRAIAHYAGSPQTARIIWEVNGSCANWGILNDKIICHATDNGRLHGATLHWGDRTLDQIMSDGEGA